MGEAHRLSRSTGRKMGAGEVECTRVCFLSPEGPCREGLERVRGQGAALLSKAGVQNISFLSFYPT